jgi:hypothetical protein
MYDPYLWTETILEQKILYAAGQPTSNALIPFGAHDPVTESDIRQALSSTEAGMQRAVELLAVEYGYPPSLTFEQLRRQLLGLHGPAEAAACGQARVPWPA